MRIGLGYDVHKLVTGRKLVLGGVTIPHKKGLLGHSDADVLLHALCDSILGAAGLKDIGYYFSNKDPRWKNISSLVLLGECMKLIKKQKLKVGNVDITVILEEPKINPYVDLMKKNIAKILGIRTTQISIKSTTSEGLGFIGKKQGCSAYSIALLK
ncbi:MAG TPA: 2-C-methyl-D-erythritol 2,4-cyclodiphosphate synthase [Ignavibacteria bacterium]|nr:2-C-methyl-D-erythritol 2,4-cyclodiphosphate synthase [Ignavibacteria bacterium]HMQ98760.1 2-C-methyl-D-erythritol 2,4-cyclodiphosphate synthase [Ignavibacteria bacterium]